MVPEAELEKTENGLVPKGEGWYVLNARAAKWGHTEPFGSFCAFEGDVAFPELGINVNTLTPGQPGCMYHGENAQEDFLVLAGECILVIEGQERPLKRWDFVHCPPWTEHVLVGAGAGPCLVLAVGARKAEPELRYPVDETARKYDAAVTEETTSGKEAYARFQPLVADGPYRAGLPPD